RPQRTWAVGTAREGRALGDGHRRRCRVRAPGRALDADRLRPRALGHARPLSRELLLTEDAVGPRGRLAELGAPGRADVRLRGRAHGALRDVVRARQPRARAGGLGAWGARHVGGPRRVLLLGDL